MRTCCRISQPAFSSARGPGRHGAVAPAADATLRLSHDMFLAMVTGKAGLKDLLLSDDIAVDGSQLDLLKFFSLFERPEGRFNIVTP